MPKAQQIYKLGRWTGLRGGAVMWAVATFTVVFTHTHTHTHTHTQPLNGRWSGTARVGRYQEKHSPTHTRPDHRTVVATR